MSDGINHLIEEDKQMKKTLGISILCAGAILLGYMSLSYAIILLVIVVLMKADKKVIRAAASSVSFYGAIYLVQRLLSYLSDWFSKICVQLGKLNIDVSEVVSKLNIFSYAGTILGFLVFVYTGFMFFAILSGTDVKVFFVGGIVDRCLGDEADEE